MPKENQLCLSATLQSWPIPFMAQPWAPPITEDNLSLLTMSSIMAQFTSLQEEKILPLKVTARDHELLEKMAQELPNVSSTSDPVFSQAMQLIDSARVLDQKTWTQQFPAISDARVGRIVDFYLQLHAVEGLEFANSLDDLSHLRPGLTAAQGYEKARVISLERDILFKLCQKSLTLSTAEKLTPLAALSLAWWLNQEYQPTLAELSMAVYRPENKETKLQAAILYNHSHYGNRYGETAGISTADLNDWGLEHLDSPELAVSRAVRVLRVIHEGMDAQPTILQAPEAYLANGFAPKNAQGSYLKKESLELGEMILTGCGQIGFDACSQQDFTQFIDFEHAVGSLAFSLKTTLKLHYQLQGRAFDELVDKNTEQLYTLLLQEEEQLHKSGGARYSPTAIFLSHFSQSNEVEPLTVEQTAGVIKRIAGSIDVSHLSESAQVTFNRINLMVDNVVAGTAIDVEHERFVSDLKSLAQLTEQSHPLYILAHYRLYKTAQEKIERQLAYLDMRLAYRHLPAAFDDDQAIREILTEAGVEKVDDSRAYYYRYSDPHKQNDSPVNEFKRRRDASNRFVANMSMPGKNGRSIDVYKTLDAKKTEYHEWIKSHPAVRSQAIKTLIEKGQRPESGALQDKINALAKDYRPETENSRFWRTAWTSLEESWVCKLPLPNPMCTIARVEGPRSRNENENMAAGMVAMVMEAGQLRGMERGVKLIENSPLGVKPSGPLAPPSRPVIPSRLPVAEGEVIPTRQTIPSPPGKPVEVQWVELKDPLVSGGMREAWVRQGGGATYWEVDLTTGKDVGVVLKQGPEFSRQGRLPGGGPTLSKATNPEFNPAIKLGKKIGSGLTAEIYLDANNPGFLLKKIGTKDPYLIDKVFKKEVEFFNRYYGEGAAELISTPIPKRNATK